MALALILAQPVQSNDCTKLRLTDDCGVYDVVTNLGGWGTPNTQLSDINGTTTTLSLDVVINYPDGTVEQYDTIDIRTTFLDETTPTTIDDLVYDLDASMLLIDGEAKGLSTESLPDGWYEITYTVDHSLANGTGTEVTYYTQQLVDGQIMTNVYDKLRQVPKIYDLDLNKYLSNRWQEIIRPIYFYSLYQGMIANLDASKKEETLNTMFMLEKLLLLRS